jgi:hypothetical protein
MDAQANIRVEREQTVRLGIPPAGWNGDPLMIVFFIALEQPMMAPEGMELFVTHYGEPLEWVKWNGGFNFVGMRLHRRTDSTTYRAEQDLQVFDLAMNVMNCQLPARPELMGEPVPSITTNLTRTVVETATPLLPTEDGDPGHAVSDAFDRCLAVLQGLTRAYVAASTDVRFRPISRQTCRMLVPMATQSIEGEWLDFGVFHVHPGEGMVPFDAEELTETERHKLRVTLEKIARGDPYIPFVERARVAHRAYRIDGDYPTTVISAQTACEILLNTVLLLMAWEEGRSREATREWFTGRVGFIRRVASQVAPRLGGNWGTQRPENPMSRICRLSDIRHAVVHAGYLPDEHEAQEALTTVDAAEAMVKERLVAKRMTYPRTALLLLGEPGLRRLQGWDTRMIAWVDSHASQEPDWISTFRSWRDAPRVK